ncbi:MAG: hypothetical protein H7246_18850 [Phycisphaerae bacterium]|nr:hypothetical protein [Saprospiraceae bacterium]
MQYMKWKWVAKGFAFGLLFVTVMTFATMLLWNNLAAAIFALPVLTFFQALGLMILGRLLTGGFWSRGWGRGQRGYHMRERWKNMPPEQREQFMQRWGKRGCGPMGGQENPVENPSA